MILGTVFVLITGTISHFIYDWSGQNYILGLIFPTNESTWEHMKLVFFPMLLCAFFLNRRLMADYPCITSALLAGILLGTFLIPVLFYSYSGILGNHFLWLDIAVFALSVILAFGASYRLTLSCRAKKLRKSVRAACLCCPALLSLFHLSCTGSRSFYGSDKTVLTKPALADFFSRHIRKLKCYDCVKSVGMVP